MRILEVLAELSSKRCGCVLVTCTQGKLLGTFTDGDLRRGLQKLGAAVSLCMHTGTCMLVCLHCCAPRSSYICMPVRAGCLKSDHRIITPLDWVIEVLAWQLASSRNLTGSLNLVTYRMIASYSCCHRRRRCCLAQPSTPNPEAPCAERCK